MVFRFFIQNVTTKEQLQKRSNVRHWKTVDFFSLTKLNYSKLLIPQFQRYFHLMAFSVAHKESHTVVTLSVMTSTSWKKEPYVTSLLTKKGNRLAVGRLHSPTMHRATDLQFHETGTRWTLVRALSASDVTDGLDRLTLGPITISLETNRRAWSRMPQSV